MHRKAQTVNPIAEGNNIGSNTQIIFEDKKCVMCTKPQSQHIEQIYCPEGKAIFGYQIAGLFEHPYINEDES